MGSAQLHGLHQGIGMRTEAPRTEEIWLRLNKAKTETPGLTALKPVSPLSQWCLLFHEPGFRNLRFQEDSNQKWPLVLTLHGPGSEMCFNSLLLIFRWVFEGYGRALFPGLYEDLSPEFKVTNPGMNPQKSHIQSFKRNFISMIFLIFTTPWGKYLPLTNEETVAWFAQGCSL